MPDPVLIYGSPELEFDLFHAVPAGITDPFLYVENGDRRVAVISVLDADKVRAAGVEAIDPIALGRDELFAQGLGVDADRARDLPARRAASSASRRRPCRSASRSPSPTTCARAGSTCASTRSASPRADASRRRGQLEGIRRAQRAADAAMAVAAELIHALVPGTTSESVREAMKARAAELGAELADDVIVAHGAQAAVGHESGPATIAPGEPVIVDIWPRDPRRAASRT